jgi:hypothetical protein
MPVPVALGFKIYNRCRSAAGIAGSNTAGGRLLVFSVCCVLCRKRPLRRNEHSPPRAVLKNACLRACVFLIA